MYSSFTEKALNKREISNPLEDETKLSVKQISGLKLSGKHQYIINYNGETLYLANSGYVALLEKRIREQLKEIRNLESRVFKLEKRVEQQNKKINELVSEMNRKKDYYFFE